MNIDNQQTDQDSNNQIEIWKPIIEYENYEVSSLGNIRHKDKKKNRTIQDNGNGYKIVGIINNGKYKNIYVHKCVLKTFNPIENEVQFETNHKNFNRSDNRLENLQWLSRKDNLLYSIKNNRFNNAHKKQSEYLKNLHKQGLAPFSNLSKESRQKAGKTHKKNYKKENHPFYCKYGENSSYHKLTEKKVIEIKKLHLSGMYNMLKLSKLYNVNYSTIYYIIKGITWKHIN